MKSKVKLIIVASSGSLFEVFDFYLFSLFAFALGHAFFQGGDLNSNLSWVFMAFGSAYVARIAGALTFGYIGDKYSRKLSFQYTILIISFASIVMGIIPPYSMIGSASIVLLFICRIIQGFSYGGELSGAIIMVGENAGKRRGFYCGLVIFLAACGAVLANITYTILEAALNPEQMISFGWRVAFVLGGLALLHSYTARESLYDSEEYRDFKKKEKANYSPISTVLKQYKKLIFSAVVMIFGTVIYTPVCVVYFPSYMQYFNLMPEHGIGTLLIIMSTCVAIGCIIGGWLSDVLTCRFSYVIFSLLSAAISFPAFFVLQDQSYSAVTVYLVLGSFALLNGCLSGVYMRYIADSFPVHVRYLCLALVTGIAVTLLAGTTPAILNALIKNPDHILLPAYVLTISYIIQTVAVFVFDRIKKNQKFINYAVEN